jgi:hypothetical protein
MLDIKDGLCLGDLRDGIRLDLCDSGRRTIMIQWIKAKLDSLRKKIKGLWYSRTHWAAVILGLLVGAQSQIEQWLQLQLSAKDYALAGVIIYAVITGLRLITTQPVESKIPDNDNR